MLEVELSFSYPSREVLRKVRFSAERGEFLAVIGPNGAGKSTLLKCMVGILRGEGRVLYEGRDLLSMRPRERARYIAYVPQSSFPEFAFTIEEFVELGTYATGGSVEEALERVGMLGRRRDFITNLSGGEYQLVLIARALAQGSNVLLLDEPTSHLDINHALEVMELLKNLKEEKTIVAVMHDLNLALTYADRLILLSGGRVVWDGKTEELEESVLKSVYGVNVKIVDVEGKKVVLATP